MTRGLRIVRDLTLATLAFQVFHFMEHTAQVAHWFSQPAAKPWLSPWAAAGRDVLALDGTPAGGSELLHLAGNGIFMIGLVGLALLAHGAGARSADIPSLRSALRLQGFHVSEHAMLTLSYLATGTAAGLSTVFGLASGPFGLGLRVWAHFLLNLVGTSLALRAFWAMWQSGALIDQMPRQTSDVVIAGPNGH